VSKSIFTSCLLAAAGLVCGTPLLAQGQKPAPAPAVRPFTTDQLAAWLCRALPGNDGRKIAATLFDGKVQGEEPDKELWMGWVMEDGQELIDIKFTGMQLLEDVGAWVLVIELEGDWHGISEQDWVALARRIPGWTTKGDHRGIKICAPGKKDCRHRGGYEAKAGVRWLQLVWGSSDPNPSAWFCSKK
jgi:hypothetical protein